MGICLPGVRNAYKAVSSKPSGSVSVPECCQPPPQLPGTHLSTCASQLLRLAAEDVVANVRICAVQALQLISGALDKKSVHVCVCVLLTVTTVPILTLLNRIGCEHHLAWPPRSIGIARAV